MIQRFRFGTPIETCAVTEQLPVTEGMLPFFEITNKNESAEFTSFTASENRSAESIRGAGYIQAVILMIRIIRRILNHYTEAITSF